ncbi:hypothetical protein MGM1_0990 [Candidatus Malacoplasma girerdii]|uniref:Uncharacterized protein n=1 Tax=Candidatus Malacoplasma girerdii TaxID=1318617 RepID=A0A097SSD1_9BACT|nr:hypothetical protein MGM1_0990 [Candidatus Malacoplasma girerdii]
MYILRIFPLLFSPKLLTGFFWWPTTIMWKWCHII